MNPHAFALLLVLGAAMLALWILARFTAFGPRTLVWAILHTLIAVVLLRLMPYGLAAIRASGVPGAIYIQVFVGALPLLVYAFLSGGWVTRLAIGLLRP